MNLNTSLTNLIDCRLESSYCNSISELISIILYSINYTHSWTPPLNWNPDLIMNYGTLLFQLQHNIVFCSYLSLYSNTAFLINRSSNILININSPNICLLLPSFLNPTFITFLIYFYCSTKPISLEYIMKSPLNYTFYPNTISLYFSFSDKN